MRTDAQEAIVTLRPESAPGFYANGLRNADNDIVRRSGMMLEKIGNRSVIPALIEAVVTTHQVPMTVVDNSNTYGFSSGPGKHQADTMGLPPDVATRILTGQYPNGVTVNPDPVMGGPRLKTVMVPRDFRNAEVLAALETLTQQNLGYDKDQWRRWWAARETIGGPATNTAGGGAGSGGGGSAAGGGTGPVIGSGPKGSASSSSSKTH